MENGLAWHHTGEPQVETGNASRIWGRHGKGGGSLVYFIDLYSLPLAAFQDFPWLAFLIST